jgi:hypothetical protein
MIFSYSNLKKNKYLIDHALSPSLNFLSLLQALLSNSAIQSLQKSLLARPAPTE